MIESFPLIAFQMISLNSMSGAASASSKFISIERCAPGAFGGLTSVRETRAGRAEYDARSGSLVNALNIGVAAASYWLMGGIPRISSMVRSMLVVEYMVLSTDFFLM